MKKARILSAMLTALIAAASIIPACGSAESYYEGDWNSFDWDDDHPELGNFGRYIDDGYELEYNFFDGQIVCDDVVNWEIVDRNTKNNTIKLHFHGDGEEKFSSIDDDEFGDFEYRSYYTDTTVRIPNTVTYPIIGNRKFRLKKVTVTGMVGSGEFKSFDVDPENKYMKCVDNVLFSKDGKTLMSYAQFDERTEYDIPEGTESIGNGAFYRCNNLKKITIPDTVTEIDPDSFRYMDNLAELALPDWVEEMPCFIQCFNLKKLSISENSKLRYIGAGVLYDTDSLKEIVIPSFDIKIDRRAFGPTMNGKQPEITIKTYVQPNVTAKDNNLTWDKVPNASYYEIYQKLGDGEYKLLRRTDKTKAALSSLKSGKNYTFAVKAFAKIPAANYDPETDEGKGYSGTKYYHYPKYFIIEGTMSEDVVLTGK